MNIYMKRQEKGRKTSENTLKSRLFDNTDDIRPCWALSSGSKKLLVAGVFLLEGPEPCSAQGALPHLLAWQEREQQPHNSINTLLKRLLIKNKNRD